MTLTLKQVKIMKEALLTKGALILNAREAPVGSSNVNDITDLISLLMDYENDLIWHENNVV